MEYPNHFVVGTVAFTLSCKNHGSDRGMMAHPQNPVENAESALALMRLYIYFSRITP